MSSSKYYLFINDTIFLILHLQVDVPYEVRKDRPLHYKLEGLMVVLFYRIAEPIIRESYMIPEKSVFDWTIEEQQKAGKVIGKKRTIIKVDPVTKTNVQASEY